MAVDLFEGREVLVSRVKSLLGTLVSSVAIAGQNNLSSSHVVAETTMTGLMNRVYGWELVNANAIRQNYPGIDLIDPKRSIAVQVTANRTTEKVRHTLKEVGRSGVVYSELIVLLLTHSKPTDAMRNCTDPAYSGAVKVWNISDVFRDAMELEPLALRELAEFLETEVGTIRERVKELPHLELPPSGFLQSTGFVGREEELEEISRRFADGDRLVVLTGLGGMGKTELAIRYGLQHRGTVYFVRFDTSFTHTLANMARSIQPPLPEEELRKSDHELADTVLKLLAKNTGEDLLILDNVDGDKESLAELQKDPAYCSVCALSLRRLMTTRSDYPRAIHVQAMDNEPLFEIFRNHGAELSEEEMRELIRAVNGHTLTVDLIARTLNGKGWRKVTAEKMLTALRENNLKDQKYRKIATDYNQSTEQAQIYEHLSVVFDLSGMPAGNRTVMGYATLLPEGGMEGECFGMSLREEEQDALDTLLERGWLEMKDGLLTIHPVIRLVCRTELAPTDEDCGEFLDRLWGQYDEKQYLLSQYTQMAELFTIAHDHLNSHHGRWLLRAARFFTELSQHQKALEYNLKALAIHENTISPEHPDLIPFYNNIGHAYGELGNHQKALLYFLKAHENCESFFPPEHPQLAISYNNIGHTYGELGHLQKALDNHMRALNIRKNATPPETPELALSYSNVGFTYGKLGKHQEALEYHQIALDIRKRVLSPEHPDLACSYMNIGYTYGELGNEQKSLKYLAKCLDIQEKVLPPEHPDLALSYMNIGVSYVELGQHHKALAYLNKSLDIFKKALPSEHPAVALSYNSIGRTYGMLNQPQKALEYLQIALEIRERTLPPEHPDLALSYNNVGYAHGNLGKPLKALEYILKALDIQEKVLPPTHPDLALSCNNIACIYHNQGDFIQAASYMRRAAEIISHSDLPKTHPNRINYLKYADEFEKKAEMQRRMFSLLPDKISFPFNKK